MTTVIQCGDEDILNVKTLTPSVQKCLKNIINKEGFTSYKVNVKDISTNGGNYFGILQTVTITGKSDDGDKELNLFLKNIVTIDESAVPFSASEIYKREGFVYTELFNLFAKIQDKFSISQEDSLNTVKSYAANGDVIILEDIARHGYKTYDRFDVIPVKFAELAIEQMAKLHAMSFVLQREHPKYFEEKIKSLRTVIKFDSAFDHIRRMFDTAKESLDDNTKIKLDNYFPKGKALYQKCTDVSEEKGVCLIHGDFRANNILVKEVNGEASKVMPVDYQLINYGCPVLDFIYFIFLSTDRKFRRKHLENLKELYYNTFETFLKKFGIDAKEVYSRKQFEENYRDQLDYGLMIFLILMPFIFAKTDDVPDLENGTEGVRFNMDIRFKDRLLEIVDDFIEWGYL